MHHFSNLKFRRQFIASSNKITAFEKWNKTEFTNESLHIKTHPDLEINTITDPEKKLSIALLGFIIDPNFPDQKNKDILEDLVSSFASIDALIRTISDLAGRFIFIICHQNAKYVIHDMCGLRTVYYTISKGEFYLASNPAILKEVLDIKPTENYQTFVESNHIKNDIEYWLPCGQTLYENVDQLVPNHYLDVNNNQQVRYWPFRKIQDQNLEEATLKTSSILESLILSANKRFKLALPLTAGWDSRILLSSSKKYLDSFFLYTLQYRWLIESSPDIKIPKYILKEFKIPYHTINCLKDMDPEFYKIFKSNVDLAHDDWAKITNGMYKSYPHDRTVLRGNVSEIARCSFYPEGKHAEVTSASQLPVAWPEWLELKFIMDYNENWLKNVKDLCKDNNIDIFDLWYWEIFMGGWQAQGQLEWDIIHEEFTPYNYRPLMETMLGVPTKYRLHEKSLLYQKIINHNWPKLLYWPFNPASWNRRHQVKYAISDLLKNIGLYNLGLKFYRFAHPIYLRIKGYKN